MRRHASANQQLNQSTLWLLCLPPATVESAAVYQEYNWKIREESIGMKTKLPPESTETSCFLTAGAEDWRSADFNRIREERIILKPMFGVTLGMFSFTAERGLKTIRVPSHSTAPHTTDQNQSLSGLCNMLLYA